MALLTIQNLSLGYDSHAILEDLITFALSGKTVPANPL